MLFNLEVLPIHPIKGPMDQIKHRGKSQAADGQSPIKEKNADAKMVGDSYLCLTETSLGEEIRLSE